MTIRLNIFSALAALSGLLFVFAAGNAAEIKVGVVNTARILNESPQVQVARERLQREFAARELSLNNVRDEIKRKEERLQRDSTIMAEEQRRQLEQEVVSGKRDYLRAQNEFREDLNIRQNEEFSKVQHDIQQLIHQLAREQQFDLIVENYVYASDRVDITNLVLQRLKQQAQSSDKTKPLTGK